MSRFGPYFILLMISLWTLPVVTGCGTAERTTLNMEFELPPNLSRLSPLSPQLSLTDSEGTRTLWGPSTLVWNPSTTSWQADITGVPTGSYVARLDLLIADGGLPSLTSRSERRAAGSGLPGLNASSPLPIAKASQTLNLPEDVSSATLSFKPADFSSDLDSDGDGLSNLDEINANLNPFSADTDGDGVSDNLDGFPLDTSESLDEDQDGIGNAKDNCISVPNPDQKDTEGDRIGDACDDDRDNDGLTNGQEVKAGTVPLDPDTDKDGILDGKDNCPLTSNFDQRDTDHDGLGDACDPDSDNDGVPNDRDNCPLAANTDQKDTDKNGIGDACTDDADGDGVKDSVDNCPLAANPDQKDGDGDKIGDACDTDDDNDGLPDGEEASLGEDHIITNPLVADTDGDGIIDSKDNCPLAANPDQKDSDGDHEGDACDCDPADPAIRIRNGIFVSKAGLDSNTGAFNNPVLTVGQGIKLANALGISSVYVTQGTYNESVTLPAGVGLYGGFQSGTSCLRDKVANISKITSTEATTVTIVAVNSQATVNGLTLSNTGTNASSIALLIANDTSSTSNLLTLSDNSILGGNHPGQTSRALVIQKASPLVTNNAIDGGSSRASIGVDLLDSPATVLSDNSIHGGHSSQSSYGIRFKNSSAAVTGNLIQTEKTGMGPLDDQRLLFHDGSGLPAGMILKGNQLGGVPNPEMPKLFIDSVGTLYTSVNDLNNLLDGDPAGGSVDGNL